MSKFTTGKQISIKSIDYINTTYNGEFIEKEIVYNEDECDKKYVSKDDLYEIFDKREYNTNWWFNVVSKIKEKLERSK